MVGKVRGLDENSQGCAEVGSMRCNALTSCGNFLAFPLKQTSQSSLAGKEPYIYCI